MGTHYVSLAHHLQSLIDTVVNVCGKMASSLCSYLGATFEVFVTSARGAVVLVLRLYPGRYRQMNGFYPIRRTVH